MHIMGPRAKSESLVHERDVQKQGSSVAFRQASACGCVCINGAKLASLAAGSTQQPVLLKAGEKRCSLFIKTGAAVFLGACACAHVQRHTFTARERLSHTHGSRVRGSAPAHRLSSPITWCAVVPTLPWCQAYFCRSLRWDDVLQNRGHKVGPIKEKDPSASALPHGSS